MLLHVSYLHFTAVLIAAPLREIARVAISERDGDRMIYGALLL